MTPEESIRTRTWVTDDGRYLGVEEIGDDHLDAIRAWLEVRRAEWIAEGACEMADYCSAWIQIAAGERARRCGEA